MKDSFGREITYLRLSVTEQCNLRCRYCAPAEPGPACRTAFLSEEEIITAVETAAGLGITKVRITGGEPLVRPGIVPLCEKISRIDGIRETVMTTNGILMNRLAVPLREAGISRVNISLDTLDEQKYAFMTGGGSLQNALDGISTALEAGFCKVKINAVLIGGFNDDEIRRLAELSVDRPVDVRFIELMPMPGSTRFKPENYIPVSRVLEALPEAIPAAEEGVARLWQLPGAAGRIGLISALSQHFCSTCSRLRLTADGHLKPCLHSAEEISIKGLDRDGMQAAMARAILAKPASHGLLDADNISGSARSMVRIGG